ncbi:hypothetical protein [Aureibaculum flavum]|nr:hypothetical protein [Aureibaculum flavum]
MKKNFNPKMILIVVSLFTSSILFSQEKPFRIGVKIGFPNGVGGNIEYVLPLLGNKLSVSLDYTGLKADKYLEDDESAKLNYMEGGFNYYFTKEGKGFYGGVSYGSFKLKGESTGYYSDDETKGTGTGSFDFTNNSVNIKLGAKLGGLFYFRPEVGFAFSGFPKAIDMIITYPDGSTEIDSFIEEGDLPNVITSGLIFNIGFGFAF